MDRERMRRTVKMLLLPAAGLAALVTVYLLLPFSQEMTVGRRIPATGDSSAIVIWVLIAAVALGGIITSIIMIFGNRK